MCHVPHHRVPDLGESPHEHLLRVLPEVVAGLKHRQLARQVGDLLVDPLANSMASVVINSTVAFERGDTFVFGSWVCVADGAGSFLRFIAATPGELRAPPPTEAPVINLVKRFGEIALSDSVREPESEFEYNSTSTATRTVPRETASITSQGTIGLPAPAIFGLRSAGAAYQAALSSAVKADSIITLEYSSDSDCASDSDSSTSEYEFDFGSDPSEVEALQEPV